MVKITVSDDSQVNTKTIAYINTIVTLSATDSETKKYPKYVGMNSLSAKLLSRHPLNESFPKPFATISEIKESKIGINNKIIPVIQHGNSIIVHCLLIP